MTKRFKIERERKRKIGYANWLYERFGMGMFTLAEVGHLLELDDRTLLAPGYSPDRWAELVHSGVTKKHDIWRLTQTG